MNGIVCAELSVGFARVEEVETFLDGTAFEMAPVPREARTGVLPLLTRDAARYRGDFPTMMLIAPSAA